MADINNPQELAQAAAPQHVQDPYYPPPQYEPAPSTITNPQEMAGASQEPQAKTWMESHGQSWVPRYHFHGPMAFQAPYDLGGGMLTSYEPGQPEQLMLEMGMMLAPGETDLTGAVARRQAYEQKFSPYDQTRNPIPDPRRMNDWLESHAQEGLSPIAQPRGPESFTTPYDLGGGQLA